MAGSHRFSFRKSIFRRLGRDEDGAYAVELALIMPFFLPLIFAILEMGLVFLAGHMLDLGTSKASRLIRVGTNPSISDFRAAICPNVGYLISCDKLQIDVRSYEDFDAFKNRNADLEMDADGNFNTSFVAGGREEIQLVRVLYNYPLVVSKFIPSNYATSEGRLLSASFVFRNEPW